MLPSNPLISLGRGWLWFHAFGLRKFGLLSGLLNERCASKSCALKTLRSPLLCVFVLTPKVTKEDWSSAHGSARNDPPVNLMRRTFGRSIKRKIFSREGGAHMWPLLDDRLSDGELHISNESCILISSPPLNPSVAFSNIACGSSHHHESGRDAPCAMLNDSLSLLVALTAVAGLLLRCQGWSDEDLLLPPINSSSRFLANLGVDVRFSKRSVEESEASPDASSLQTVSHCNVSVQRLLPTSLVARWDSSFGFQCDVLIYTTNNHGRAFFSASFNRAISPVVIEHLGVTGGQQELRLCVGCGMSRYRRFSQGRSRGQNSGDQIAFCCVDFSLDELKGDKSWRLNRKPIESTLVACFMTLVIIVWSVAALIWPVPIIAGFLPNGMEQRRPR